MTETNRDKETEKTESSDLCYCVDRDRKSRFIPLCRQRQTEKEKTERSDLCYCVDRDRQRHRDREDRKIRFMLLCRQRQTETERQRRQKDQIYATV